MKMGSSTQSRIFGSRLIICMSSGRRCECGSHKKEEEEEGKIVEKGRRRSFLLLLDGNESAYDEIWLFSIFSFPFSAFERQSPAMDLPMSLLSSGDMESRVVAAFKDENSYSQVQRAKFKSVEQYHD
jgi:hypothetical protein